MKLYLGITVVAILVICALIAGQYLLPSDSADMLTLAVTVLFAALSALSALLTVRELQKERIERDRPFVLVDFEATHRGMVYLMIRNLGGGPAQNVRFEFNPVPVTYNGEVLSELPFFQRPLPILVPGKEFHHFIGGYHQLASSGRPLTYTVTVSYEWSGKKNETIEYSLDLHRYFGMIVPPKTQEESLEDISVQTEKIVKTLKDVVRMGRFRVEVHEPPTQESLGRVSDDSHTADPTDADESADQQTPK